MNEDQVNFDCKDCGRTFCTESEDHENSEGGVCGYCCEGGKMSLIERIHKQIEEVYKEFDDCELLQLLESCGQEILKHQWIPTENRLPDHDGMVLMWGSHQNAHIGFYSEVTDKWFDSEDGEWLTGVTRWMELPNDPA